MHLINTSQMHIDLSKKQLVQWYRTRQADFSNHFFMISSSFGRARRGVRGTSALYSASCARTCTPLQTIDVEGVFFPLLSERGHCPCLSSPLHKPRPHTHGHSRSCILFNHKSGSMVGRRQAQRRTRGRAIPQGSGLIARSSTVLLEHCTQVFSLHS